MSIPNLALDCNTHVRSHIITSYGYKGELLDLFVKSKDKAIHKYHHYIPLYDKYFSSFRGTKVRFLEIGVSGGGSLAMWRKYLGSEAIIYGIDIDPQCYKFNDQDAQIRIGSQDDKTFLQAVISEMGGVDIVLDDGSHIMRHILFSFKVLFPLLSDGGIYFVEDLHTCYWRAYGGAYRSKGNFFAFVSELMDDMHRWHHSSSVKHLSIASSCTGIHIHDSIVVFDKSKVFPPIASRIS